MGHTSHAIVGEPLAELIDDDEEDAQGVAKAAWLEARDRQREPRQSCATQTNIAHCDLQLEQAQCRLSGSA